MKDTPKVILKVILLILLNLAFAYIMGNYIVKIPAVEQADKNLYEAVHNGPHPKWLDQIIAPLNFNFLPREWGFTFPSFFYIWIGVFLIYLFIWRRKDFFWALLSFLLGGFFATQLFAFTDHFVTRDRPFINNPNNLDAFSEKVWKNWPTFPSGHARETAIFAVVTAYYLPFLRILAVLFALFVGYSRVYLGAHFPTDSLAGLVMGYMAGVTTLIVVSHIRTVYGERRSKKNEQKKAGES